MTHYDFEDYRQPQKPKLGSWPFWQVPEFYALSYVIRLALVMVVMPYLFGIKLTAIGLFSIFFLFDYFTYRGLKTVYGLE
jgi:hypothetical protein